MKYISLLLPILLTACTPSSSEDFKREGESICQELTLDLQKIQTREELLRALPRFKKTFNSLVQLMIQAHKYQLRHPEEESFDSSFTTYQTNLELMSQLRRIYQIEGGQELIERAEREALIRLDGSCSGLLESR